MARVRYTMYKVVDKDNFVWGWCWSLADAEALAKKRNATVVKEKY